MSLYYKANLYLVSYEHVSFAVAQTEVVGNYLDKVEKFPMRTFTL